MFWYFVFAAILFLLNLAEYDGWKAAGACAAVLLAGVAGLRYETGYDWVEYEHIFLLTPALGESDIYANIAYIDVEIGWQFLSSVLKSLGFRFEALIFIVAVFNFWVLYKFSRIYSSFVVITLIWYYGFNFLAGPLAAIRQCASISFILLAFMAFDRGKPVPAIILSVVGVLFHAFTTVFAPFVFLRRKLPQTHWVALWTLLPLALLFVSDISLLNIAVRLLGSLLPAGLVTAKLELYSSSTGARLSPMLALLLGWHFTAYFLIAKGSEAFPQRMVLRFAGWVTVLNLVAHCYFFDYPVLWNRVMLLSFFLQAVALTNIFEQELRDQTKRALIGLGATAVSCVSLFYMLSNSQALAFTPYQSQLVVLFRGNYGDGRVRYAVVREEIDRAAAETRMAVGSN